MTPLWQQWARWASGIFARRLSTEQPGESERQIYLSPRTQAGVFVDPERAMAQATVWACITYISRTVAQLPWYVMRERRQGGGADRVAGHGVDWLCNVRPNPEMGAFTWRQAMLGTALRYGNAYAEIERDNRAMPIALWPLHPTRVQPARDGAGQLFYRVTNAGGRVDLDPADVYHVRGFGDGPVGMNVVEYAAQSIGWAQATELFGASYFGEGMNPAGVVEIQGSLSPDALRLLREEFAKLYRGAKKAHRTAFLDAGMKWQKMTTTPEEGQFVATMQHQVENICRWFGVPPHKVQHLLRSTFSNIEQQNTEVVIDTIVPWVRVFEDEANYKFFGQNRQGLFTKIAIQGLLRGDSQARAALYKAMRELGALNANEIRALEDMNGIGPAGDAYFVPANMMTLERAIAAVPVTATPPVDDDEQGDPVPPKLNGNGRAYHG